MHDEPLHQPIVTCAQGALAGIQRDDVDAFFNIPYAAPLGVAQRFALPRAPHPWHGVRDASKPGPVFPQTPSRLTAVMGTTPGFAKQSEDAFALNVWAPAHASDKPLPVLVWIHGGGWLTGGAPLEWYHGDRLAASGRLLVVSINYRLGVVGNLYLPEQTQGSMALHDLCAALRWIRDNVAAFGGDASRVTVCGQSAGAWYTAALTHSPFAQGLFGQAILLSLPGSIAPQSQAVAEGYARQFCSLLDVQPDLDALRRLPVERILEGQSAFSRAHSEYATIPPTFLPLAGDALPVDRLDVQPASDASSMRYMLGSLPDEMGAFFSHDPRVLDATDADTLARFITRYGDRGSAMLDAHKRAFPLADNYTRLLSMVSDEIFRAPTQRLANAIAGSGSTCFVYEFVEQSAMPRAGACHCFELPFLFEHFDAWRDAPMMPGLDLDRAGRVAAAFQKAIINFAVNGDPNGENLPHWPAYTSDRRHAMRFGDSPDVGIFVGDHLVHEH